MKSAYLVAGGSISESFAAGFLGRRESDSIVVAVDAGLELLDRAGIRPDVLVGDFDTVDYDILNKYIDRDDIIIERHNPVKDYSDTELAVDTCAKLGYHSVYILGCFGGRIDHSLANIYLTCTGLNRDMYIYLIDEFNKVYSIDHSFEIKKNEQWGRYISLYPMGGAIDDFSISGVKYPLENVRLDKYKQPTYTISNEITEETAKISFAHGVLLIVESRDAKEAV